MSPHVQMSSLPPLICLSHLRWNFVFQRPQHLLSRFARDGRVYFVEEPLTGAPALEVHNDKQTGVEVWVPRTPPGIEEQERDALIRELVTARVKERVGDDYISWYYTPLALNFTGDLRPAVTVYDCMDQLSAFAGADRRLVDLEQDLLQKADLVFTGGASLYAAKRPLHPRVHLFASSIDYTHFSQARQKIEDPSDQRSIPHPRVGYFGVIDERLDLELLRSLSERRPEWHIVMVGPVVKIDPATLPQAPNIHYLGQRQYAELPAYLANWDVAMMPFAKNEATKFISPTKTPEYLAGGKPVVSTSITDVVTPYGDMRLVRIADDSEGFARALEAGRASINDAEWLRRVDEQLRKGSWDETWASMQQLIIERLLHRSGARAEMGGANNDTRTKPRSAPAGESADPVGRPGMHAQPGSRSVV